MREGQGDRASGPREQAHPFRSARTDKLALSFFSPSPSRRAARNVSTRGATGKPGRRSGLETEVGILHLVFDVLLRFDADRFTLHAAASERERDV